MKEYNIKRHYETKHSAAFDKFSGLELFEKAKELCIKITKQQQIFLQGGSLKQEMATRASYEVSKLIAEHGKAFSEGEFIKKCPTVVVETMCPDQADLFSTISLSRNTVTRRVEELALSVRQHIIEKGKQFASFSVACDENTDVIDTTQLLTFVRGVDRNFTETEELLGMSSMLGATKCAGLFEEVVKTVDRVELQWGKLCSVTTDDAPCISGVNTGMVELVKQKVEAVGGTVHKLHCIIHQEVLYAKAANFEGIMETVAKTINFIRSRALNHRCFKQCYKKCTVNLVMCFTIQK
jgi:hypothetical protein